VGTKSLLARQLGRLEGLGVDLVAMNVNDLLAAGAEPLFFLDYLAVPRLHLEQAQAVVRGIVRGCKEAGCALIGPRLSRHGFGVGALH
jgi:phosphoribosylformylglycinamidine cyclo-ligase